MCFLSKNLLSTRTIHGLLLTLYIVRFVSIPFVILRIVGWVREKCAIVQVVDQRD